MSDSRVTPWHRDISWHAADDAQFISDEGLVAIAKMGDGTVSFTCSEGTQSTRENKQWQSR